MQTKRYRLIRNAFALILFAVSILSLLMPYQYIGGTYIPFRFEKQGYELMYPYLSVLLFACTVTVMIALSRKWTPLWLLLLTIAEVLSIFVVYLEIHFFAPGREYLRTGVGTGFIALTACSLLLFLICCINLLIIRNYKPEPKSRHDLIDEQ